MKNLIYCIVPIEHGVTKLLHSVQVKKITNLKLQQRTDRSNFWMNRLKRFFRRKLPFKIETITEFRFVLSELRYLFSNWKNFKIVSVNK